MKTISKNLGRKMSAVRAIGYALTTADYAGWSAASALFAVYLRPSEIASLAIAALGALDEDVYREVVKFVEGEA